MENMPNLIGVMAFSQGVRVLAGLLLYLARTAHPLFEKIKFAIVCCATHPPLWIDAETEEWWKNKESDGLDSTRKLRIPSLHLVGTNDAWKGEAV